MKKILKRIGKITFLTLLTFGSYFGLIRIDGNLHEVVPNEFFRSAQLSPEQLQRAIDSHGIKSVINLRGENLKTPWYIDELAVTKSANIEHINFRVSAKRLLPEERMHELIEVMKNAPKPVLVHCQAGADRSGLASALYVAAIKNGTPLEAKLQLSPLYGHLPINGTVAYPMTQSYEAFKSKLDFGS